MEKSLWALQHHAKSRDCAEAKSLEAGWGGAANEAYDDDPAKFPFGSYFFQNFTKHKVAANMGGERFVVEPEHAQHLVSSDEKALHLRLAVSEESEKGWKMIFDSFYPNWSERRTLIFIYNTVRNGRSRIETRTLIENQAVWDQAMKPASEE